MNLSVSPYPISKTSFCGQIGLRQIPDILDLAEINSEKYLEAKKYLENKKRFLLGKPSLQRFNLKKLDGIQEGIDVFSGSTMEQIAYMSKKLSSVLLARGCRNHCSHCYISALPPEKGKINTINWDDLLSLTKGVKELRHRLGFNFVKTNNRMLIPFEDSDLISFKSFDKEGNPHNIAEALKIMHEAFGRKLILDTTGWNKNDEWSRKAASDVVKLAFENPNMFEQINISISPFHSIIDKSIELNKLGKIQEAIKLRNIYTDRISEALVVFAPLYNIKLANKTTDHFLASCAPSTKENVGYLRSDSIILYREIVKKVVEKCQNLPMEQQKINAKALDFYQKHIPDFSIIAALGRGKKFYDGRWIKCSVDKDIINKFGEKYIDVNGQILVGKGLGSNNLSKATTDIRLNFSNKDKETQKIQVQHHIDNPSIKPNILDYIKCFIAEFN